MSDWIPIEEKEPPKYIKILQTVRETTWDGKIVEHVVYRVWSGSPQVTAWMFAPSPYKRSNDYDMSKM